MKLIGHFTANHGLSGIPFCLKPPLRSPSPLVVPSTQVATDNSSPTKEMDDGDGIADNEWQGLEEDASGAAGLAFEVNSNMDTDSDTGSDMHSDTDSDSGRKPNVSEGLSLWVEENKVCTQPCTASY